MAIQEVSLVSAKADAVVTTKAQAQRLDTQVFYFGLAFQLIDYKGDPFPTGSLGSILAEHPDLEVKSFTWGGIGQWVLIMQRPT